ncbi:hypothetical protein [Endozoicomonas sp. ONNA1]|uniref:hypothetical protein n=1 Tax=Endozoicomonas sp. ONNA1 TaxID=2828740 RepID=UPI0021485C9A|nr:hypothetical protein [Endozoicomonas sp. ONNA1]
MKVTQLPFNVDLLIPDKKRLEAIKPVTSGDIYDGASNNLHDDGLYSTAIFGRLGAPERSERFSFIDMQLEIIHPTILKHIFKLKSYHRDIISGVGYATWDAKNKQFLSSNELDGQTGYSFFMKHVKDIVYEKTSSIKRDVAIGVMKKYKDNMMLRYHVVLPAGLRDLEVKEDGRTTEDEINPLYRKLLAISKTIHVQEHERENPVYDKIRWQLQLTALEIYELIFSWVAGKKGFFQGKWGKRRIFNGTRNVITSQNSPSVELGGARDIDVTTGIIGLWQGMKGTLPLCVYHIRNGFLSQVISEGENTAWLVNDKFEKIHHTLSSEASDFWGTTDGIEKMIHLFGNAEIRAKEIKVDGHYLGLVYEEDDSFKFFNDINELKQVRDLSDAEIKTKVRPITWGEFLYVSCAKVINGLPAIVTRYPVTGVGSTYPSRLYVKSTIKSRSLKELNQEWVVDEERIFEEYPIIDKEADWMESFSPSPTRLLLLGAD